MIACPRRADDRLWPALISTTGIWATANYWGGENMGNVTATDNWSTNGSSNVTIGDRGNVVFGNTTVTNSSWPSGAQTVTASAGVQAGGGQQNVRIVGGQSGRCVEIGGFRTTNGAQAQLWDCNGQTNQRWALRNWTRAPCAAALVPGVARADNPIIQHIYTADQLRWCATAGCTSTRVMTRTARPGAP